MPSPAPIAHVPVPPHVLPGQYFAFDLDADVLRFPASADGYGDADFPAAMADDALPGPAFGELADAVNRAGIVFVTGSLGASVNAVREGFRRFLLSDRARAAGIDLEKFVTAMRYYLDATGTHGPVPGAPAHEYLDLYLGMWDFYPVADPQVACLLSSGDEPDAVKLKSAAMRMMLRSVANLAARLPGSPRPLLEFPDGSPASPKGLVEKFTGGPAGLLFCVRDVPLTAPVAKGPRRGARGPRKASGKRKPGR